MDTKKCNCFKSCNCLELRNLSIDYLYNVPAGDPPKKIQSKKKSESPPLIIEDIGARILKRLIDSKDYKELILDIPIQSKVNFLTRYINSYITESGDIPFKGNQIEEIIKFVLNNIQSHYMEKCSDLIPYLHPIQIEVEQALEKIKFGSYQNLLMKVIIQSYNYTDLTTTSDMLGLLRDKTINFGRGRNLPMAVVVALFSRKLPIVEHLYVRSDSFNLLQFISDLFKTKNKYQIREVDSRKYLAPNYDLFRLKIGDPNPYTYNGDPKDAEIRRVLTHCMLKASIYDLRDGNFDSQYHTMLSNLITSHLIKYPEYTKTPKGQLEAILRIASYMPTTIIEQNLQREWITRNVYFHTFKRPSSGLGNLDQNYFNMMVSDMNSINAMCMSNNFDPRIMRPIPMYFPKSTSPFPSIHQSTGIFIVEIERMTIINGCTTGIDTSPRIIDSNIILCDRNFRLTSAILVKSGTPSWCTYPNIDMASEYTLVQHGSKWFKYDPSALTTPMSRDSFAYDSILGYYNRVKTIQDPNHIPLPSLTIPDLRDLLNSDMVHLSEINKILDNSGKYPVNSFLIDQTVAMDEIMRYGILLIYSTTDFVQDCMVSRNEPLTIY